MAGNGNGDTTLANFIWKNAEDLWGDFKHTDFGKIILPFTLLRRLECVLEPTREAVLKAHEKHKQSGIDLDLILRRATKYPFYNTSQYSLETLGATKTRQNLEDYVASFSANARVIFEQFDFTNTIGRLAGQKVLFKICQNFAGINLHPDAVPDRVMSNVYEHLIRRFGAAVNEQAEDFMTPRDVVHLATTLVLDPDDKLFAENPGLIRTLYDPTCGTGGFLTDAMNHIESFRDRSAVPPVLVPYGQELEPETHAVCLAGMLLRTLESDPGRDLSKNIKLGSTLSNDQFPGERFHYGLSNPPFGKKWEKDQEAVNREHEEKGYTGRFGPKLPRVSDGSMLFLLHLVSKLELPEKGGGRAAIVLSGSPLFTGGAGQGETEIRRYLLTNDLVDAIVALPTEIFFRTGIGTYVWILSNNKPAYRKGKVHLIDATEMATQLRRPEGNKRRFISGDQIVEIAKIYADAEDTKISKVMDYRDFGYRRIKMLRPLRMALHIGEEGLAKLKDQKAWGKLEPQQRAAWRAELIKHLGEVYKYGWAADFAREVAEKRPSLGKVSKSFLKALVNSFGVRDSQGEIVMEDSEPVPDDELTDYENVPLLEDVNNYVAREVLPHVPDAYIDQTYRDETDNEIGIVGFEINFNRYFYEFKPPRALHEIDEDLKAISRSIMLTLEGLAE
jgi:type I restriction enzyme M protein